MFFKRNFSIVMIGLLAACSSRQPSLLPTAQPSQTPTSTTTRTPTATQAVPTAVTPTFLPTFTPALPASVTSNNYSVKEWSPEEADKLIANIAGYLDSIESYWDNMGVYGYEYYLEQYKYLAFAEQEAILRFPHSPQAEKWRWDLCYNLARSFVSIVSSDAPELSCYTRLIENGLNSGQASLASLPAWFLNHEERFPIEISPASSPEGFESSSIITLEHNAYLWLSEEQGVFRVQGLLSNIDFFREASSEYQLIDLTGDNFPELVLDFGISYCCGFYTLQYVYDLSSGKPRVISFSDLTGTSLYTYSESDSYITSIGSGEMLPGLIFNSTYGNPIETPCNLRRYDKYFWTGGQFEWVKSWLDIEKPNEYDNQELCNFALATVSNPEELIVTVNAIAQMDRNDTHEFRNQILYRLGEYHAQLGDTEKAFDFFNHVIADAVPSGIAPSVWVQASKIFLDSYKSANDYYRICSRITICDIHDALQAVVNNFSIQSYSLAIEDLKSSGVPVKAAGVYNFSAWDNFDYWMVIRSPHEQQLEYWLLIKGDDKIYALFVGNVSEGNPAIINYLGNHGEEFYELNTSDGRVIFSVKRLELTDQPFIYLINPGANLKSDVNRSNLLQSMFEQNLDVIGKDIFAGTNPDLAHQSLTRLKESSRFDCQADKRCDQFYYLLGLTDELAGDKQDAIVAYLQLWREYPDSPYTIMARSKLILIP